MDLAQRIDHTLLKAEATRPQARALVSQAMQYGFASVCVNGCFVADVAKTLHGSLVKTCAVAGFPLGAMKSTVKAMEATSLAKDGAQEIDFVAHLPHLLKKDVAAAKAEFMEIVKAARAANPAIVIKVIVESAHLMAEDGEARIEAACRAVRESGCDFIKTSTGFHPAGGATVEAVQLMKKHSGGLYVKASGGIRSYDDAMRMIDAGADRLGCSAGVAIVQESKAADDEY
jgi:deoxyribose-phosphate aldolase